METGRGDADLNSLAVLASGEARDTHALVRVLTDYGAKPHLAVVVDGDAGGQARLKFLAKLLASRGIPSKALPDGTSTEDHLPLVEDLYVEALARYCFKLLADNKQRPGTFKELHAAARTRFADSFAEGKVTRGVADWAERVGQELTGLDSPPSKVGVAREYVSLLADTPTDRFTAGALQRPKRLLELIQDMLGLPLIGAAESSILRSSTDDA